MPYKDPEKARANARLRGKRYRERHAEQVRERRREQLRQSRAEDAERFREYARKFKELHPGYFAEKMRAGYYRDRVAIFQTVGTACAGCGWTDPRVLEFDHIEDDGGADRRRFGGMRTMYGYYARHPDEARARLQVLCRNCNWLKRKGEPLPSKG